MMDSTALRRWLVLVSLLGLTLYLVWNSPEPETQPMAIAKPSREAAASSSQGMAWQATARPLAQAEGEFRFTPRAPTGDAVVDLFAPAVVKRPQADLQQVVREVAPAPQAPPLPFTFVGKMTEGGAVKIFLQADDVLYGIKVGDTFAQQYKLMEADSGKLSLLYLPLNITQTMFYRETP